MKPCGLELFCRAFSMSSFKSISSFVIAEKVVVSSGSAVVFENGVIFKIVCMHEKQFHELGSLLIYSPGLNPSKIQN